MGLPRPTGAREQPLSDDRPLTVVIIDQADKIDTFLDEVSPLLTGLIVIMDVERKDVDSKDVGLYQVVRRGTSLAFPRAISCGPRALTPAGAPFRGGGGHHLRRPGRYRRLRRITPATGQIPVARALDSMPVAPVRQ